MFNFKIFRDSDNYRGYIEANMEHALLINLYDYIVTKYGK